MKKAKCQNPDCRCLSDSLQRYDFGRKASFLLCSPCYAYSRLEERLRPADETGSHRLHRARCGWDFEFKPCHNPNCRTIEMAGRRFNPENQEYYCMACFAYLKTHDGQERPERLVASARSLRENRQQRNGVVKPNRLARFPGRRCSNVNCRTTDLSSGGRYNGRIYCCACYSYTKTHEGHSRPGRLVSSFKMRRQCAGIEVCCNPNCRTTWLKGGGYYNRGRYCSGCVIYLRKHEGKQRPKNLVKQARQHKGTYIWKLMHPWQQS